MTDRLDPLETSQQIEESYKRYLKTLLWPRDGKLAEAFDAEIDATSMLTKGCLRVRPRRGNPTRRTGSAPLLGVPPCRGMRFAHSHKPAATLFDSRIPCEARSLRSYRRPPPELRLAPGLGTDGPAVPDHGGQRSTDSGSSSAVRPTR